ncbi:UPF0696 protein C11orf68 homolog [Saccoglossus kowalevskii]|uniref:UPF0696 protein C11orf68 homolog n=1 Tax=Saccoglossus kowalevskii TaxID=10224 RepID=A0ABM0MSB2_SACKO|nr:PREDICTED: UPF0696 protein C11orf68 homolog [Saccoglossus kowalevskii]
MAYEEALYGYDESDAEDSDGLSDYMSGVASIHVKSLDFSKLQRSVKGLQEEWKLLQQSGRPINYHTIYDLAKAHNVTSGKWLIHFNIGYKADLAWHVIAVATVNSQLGPRAKISMRSREHVPNSPKVKECGYMIRVYSHADFTDKQQVYDLENKIRAVGI